MRLTIRNKSSYRTDDLRKLVTLALKEEGMWAPDGRYLVDVRDCKGSGCHGLGWLDSSRFLLSLPTYYGPQGQRKKYAQELPYFKVMELARVTIHEIGHTKGLNHDTMADWWSLEVPWVEGLRIRVAEAAKPKVVTIDERVEARAAKVDAKVVEIEGKLQSIQDREKRLKKRLTKYRAKQRYYRKAAASKLPPADGGSSS